MYFCFSVIRFDSLVISRFSLGCGRGRIRSFTEISRQLQGVYSNEKGKPDFIHYTPMESSKIMKHYCAKALAH